MADSKTEEWRPQIGLQIGSGGGIIAGLPTAAGQSRSIFFEL
jgi:hypothetical protein